MVAGQPFLSIIIPAYNEESCISDSLEKLSLFLLPRSWHVEVLVIDDGSLDRTAPLAEEFRPGEGLTVQVLRLESNQGKGAAVKLGMARACGELVCYMDADLSYDLSALENAVNLLAGGQADIVIGDRTHPESRSVRPYPWLRKLSGVLFSVLIQIFLFREVFDTQCGFKLCTASTARELFPKLTIPGFGFDVEWLFLAARSGKRIRKIPVVLNHSHDSRVRVLRDSALMFCNLFMIRYNFRMGRYDEQP